MAVGEEKKRPEVNRTREDTSGTKPKPKGE